MRCISSCTQHRPFSGWMRKRVTTVDGRNPALGCAAATMCLSCGPFPCGFPNAGLPMAHSLCCSGFGAKTSIGLPTESHASLVRQVSIVSKSCSWVPSPMSNGRRSGPTCLHYALPANAAKSQSTNASCMLTALRNSYALVVTEARLQMPSHEIRLWGTDDRLREIRWAAAAAKDAISFFEIFSGILSHIYSGILPDIYSGSLQKASEGFWGPLETFWQPSKPHSKPYEKLKNYRHQNGIDFNIKKCSFQRGQP